MWSNGVMNFQSLLETKQIILSIDNEFCKINLYYFKFGVYEYYATDKYYLLVILFVKSTNKVMNVSYVLTDNIICLFFYTHWKFIILFKHVRF